MWNSSNNILKASLLLLKQVLIYEFIISVLEQALKEIDQQSALQSQHFWYEAVTTWTMGEGPIGSEN